MSSALEKEVDAQKYQPGRLLVLVLLHKVEVAYPDNILKQVGARHPATSERIKEGFLVHLLEQ